jgi:hypothetical protein
MSKYEIRYAKQYKAYILWKRDKFLWLTWWFPHQMYKKKKHALKAQKRLSLKAYQRKNQKLIC